MTNQDNHTRHIIIAGPGGVGKTTIAPLVAGILKEIRGRPGVIPVVFSCQAPETIASLIIQETSHA